MEEIIKKLYEAYKTAMDTACRTQDLFGSGDWKTIAAFSRVSGLEDAFEIVAGMSTVDYTLNNI